jgi:enterochelin esterase-like enzyme
VGVEGDVSKRFVLCTPRHLRKGERVPLLVLLHGLGETGDERMGAWAWVERYGLGTAYDRLRRAPVARISSRDDWGDVELVRLNAELASQPFRGLVIACPFMPDLPIAQPAAFDGYARWLADVVVPRARAEAPALDGAEHTLLGGCSLGGHFSLEVLLRRPDFFSAWGGVQTAIGTTQAALYAEKLAHAGPRDLLVETSTSDAFVRGNEALDAALSRHGVAHTFVELPGPHDQPWLRESGTLRMLAWFDARRRAERRIEPPPFARPFA